MGGNLDLQQVILPKLCHADDGTSREIASEMLHPDFIEERQVLVDAQDVTGRFQAVFEPAARSLENRFQVGQRLRGLRLEAAFHDLVCLLRIPWGCARAENERSEEHTSELQSRFGSSYAVFCLKKKQ